MLEVVKEDGIMEETHIIEENIVGIFSKPFSKA
jgi:hypothetical protein